MKNCAILGAGGHAKVAIAALRSAGWAVSGAYDDDPARHGGQIGGVPIVGDVAAALKSGLPIHMAIGSNRARQKIAGMGNTSWASAVHTGSQIESGVEIGDGALICMGALIQVDARIGRHAIVNTGAIVEHDCILGDFVHLAPGTRLAGAVEIGEGAMLGIGAQVIPGVKIGAWATVGAGAVVIRDVPEGATVAGSPAKALR